MKMKRSERKLFEYASAYQSDSGISMDFGYTKLNQRSRLTVCLLRGILVFLCQFGTMGLFITSFDLPCRISVLLVVSLISSVGMGLLYYNNLTFNLGYIVYFIAFIAMAILTRWYANSGMNAVLNCVMSTVDEKMNLQGVRVYTEVITNRTVTITCCMLNIMALMICLYNNVISGMGSPFFTLLLMYPVVQVCMYLDDSLNYFYLAMILCGFLGVVLLRLSHRYQMPMKNTAKNVKISKGRIIRTSERFAYATKQVVIAAAVLTAVLLILGGVAVGIAPKYRKNNYSKLKNKTDPIVKDLALSGIMAFFNQYASTGGLNEGRLGGVRSVRFDMEPDLMVEHVPDNVDGFYLRGFVGEVYESNSWKPLASTETLQKAPYRMTDSMLSEVANKESALLAFLYENNSDSFAKAKMNITNLDANPNYLYMPYYAVIRQDELPVKIGARNLFNGDLINSTIRINQTRTLEYYPYSLIQEAYNDPEEAYHLLENYDNSIEESYRKYVYRNYLRIPDNIRETLNKICDEYISGDTTLEIAESIMRYFYQEFRYTQQPGITPYGQDFVEYFLTKQKHGFCAHFATAAAMLLRAEGIPARYVEGYYVQYDDAIEMTELENEDPSDWYEGRNITLQEGESLSVLRVNVPDANAHAWVELYMDGFGWIPVEFTVAESEDTTDGGSFWSRFGGLLSGGDSDGDSPVAAVAENFKNAAPVIAIVIIAGAVAFFALFAVKRLRRHYALFDKKDNARLVNQYMALTAALKRFGNTEKKNIYHRDMAVILAEKQGVSAGTAERYLALVEQASFSGKTLSEEELTEGTNLFRNIIKAVTATIGRKDRFLLRMTL